MNTHMKIFISFKIAGHYGINANFVFLYISTFIHYLYLKMLANVKIDVSW